MRNHYIDKKGNVLVSIKASDEIKKGFYLIPPFHYTSSIMLISQVGLFKYCKAVQEANYNNNTKLGAIVSYLRDNNHNIDIWFNGKLTKLESLYEFLFLSTIYGTNGKKKVINDFIIPFELLKNLSKKYNSQLIKNFQTKLLNEGKIINYV